jgi:ABC-type branched-subunit amino acid transport system substrate-binding protein
VRIGLTLPGRNGEASDELLHAAGEAARMGALLAVMQAQQQGTRRVSLVPVSAPVLTSGAEQGLAAAGKLHGLVGGLGAGQAEALGEVADASGVPFFNLASTVRTPRRSAAGRHTFNLGGSNAMYLNALLAHHYTAGRRRWFLLAGDSAAGRALHAQAREALSGFPGAAVVGSLAVSAREALFTPLFMPIRESTAEAVLVLLDAREQLAFLAQFSRLGPRLPVALLTCPVTQSHDYARALERLAGRAGTPELVTLWEAARPDGDAAALNEGFFRRWYRPMDPAAWAAWAAVSILLASIDRTGTTDGAALSRFLEHPAAGFEVGKGARLSFDPEGHQLQQPLYVISPERGRGPTAG